jgi:hypothetical protein
VPAYVPVQDDPRGQRSSVATAQSSPARGKGERPGMPKTCLTQILPSSSPQSGPPTGRSLVLWFADVTRELMAVEGSPLSPR